MSDKIVNLLQQENVSLNDFSLKSLYELQFRKKSNLYSAKNQTCRNRHVDWKGNILSRTI